MSNGLSIATLIWRLGMMCICSKERIAFCAQVEGTWGEISRFHPLHCNPVASVYPMNPFRCMVTVGPNARVIVETRRPTEREELFKQRLEGNMSCDAWYWGRTQSNPPPGCLCRLWWSAYTLTEPFSPDGNIFSWWGSPLTVSMILDG